MPPLFLSWTASVESSSLHYIRNLFLKICQDIFWKLLHPGEILVLRQCSMLINYYFFPFSDSTSNESIKKEQLENVKAILAAVPKSGSFDLNQVMNSVYFFSWMSRKSMNASKEVREFIYFRVSSILFCFNVLVLAHSRVQYFLNKIWIKLEKNPSFRIMRIAVMLYILKPWNKENHHKPYVQSSLNFLDLFYTNQLYALTVEGALIKCALT